MSNHGENIEKMFPGPGPEKEANKAPDEQLRVYFIEIEKIEEIGPAENVMEFEETNQKYLLGMEQIRRLEQEMRDYFGTLSMVVPEELARALGKKESSLMKRFFQITEPTARKRLEFYLKEINDFGFNGKALPSKKEKTFSETDEQFRKLLKKLVELNSKIEEDFRTMNRFPPKELKDALAKKIEGIKEALEAIRREKITAYVQEIEEAEDKVSLTKTWERIKADFAEVFINEVIRDMSPGAREELQKMSEIDRARQLESIKSGVNMPKELRDALAKKQKSL